MANVTVDNFLSYKLHLAVGPRGVRFCTVLWVSLSARRKVYLAFQHFKWSSPYNVPPEQVSLHGIRTCSKDKICILWQTLRLVPRIPASPCPHPSMLPFLLFINRRWQRWWDVTPIMHRVMASILPETLSFASFDEVNCQFGESHRARSCGCLLVAECGHQPTASKKWKP